MPPKFNPPRPSTSTPASAPKSKGRPRGSTNKPKTSPSRVKKIKTTSSANGKTGGVSGKKAGERLSAASVRSLLPSLSPDTEEEMDGFEEEGIEIEISNDSDDPFASQPRTSASRIQAEDSHALELDERKEKIPDDLLAVILNRLSKQEGSRMSRDAVKAVGKYVDTFLREGVARAAWAGRGGGMVVEDLEKLAPQLLLDF